MAAIEKSGLLDINAFQGNNYGATLDSLSDAVASALQRSGGGEKGLALGGAPAQDSLPAADDVRQAIAGLCGGVLMPGLLQNNVV